MITKNAAKMAALAGQPLSDREYQVLLGMARGRTNAGIGRDLGISEHTVKTFGMRMFAKLQVHARAEAVHAACQGGLIDTPASPAPLPAPQPARAKRTDLRISPALAEEVLYVVGHAAAGAVTPAVIDQARHALSALNKAAGVTTVPAQRTRDSRP